MGQYSETSLIRHLYNPTFSLIRPLYEIQSPYIRKYGKRHSIIQQPPNLTLFSGPIECWIREVSLYEGHVRHQLRIVLYSGVFFNKNLLQFFDFFPRDLNIFFQVGLVPVCDALSASHLCISLVPNQLMPPFCMIL